MSRSNYYVAPGIGEQTTGIRPHTLFIEARM
jgi:hypothetical protein